MGFAALCPSYDFGDVAQLVEHLLCKQGVVGSIPSISTKDFGMSWRLYLQGDSSFDSSKTRS